MRKSPLLLARIFALALSFGSFVAGAQNPEDVRAFNRALDSQSARLLAEARGKVTASQLTIIDRTLRSFRLKAQAAGASAKFVKQMGSKAATAIVATEVLTTALGLGLAGAGLPGVGSIFAAPIWAPVGGGTYLGYKSVAEEASLSHELKRMSMLELRKLRKEILGFGVSSRLFAISSEAGRDATAGVQIVKGRTQAAGALGVTDLEDIIRKGTDIDRAFLEAVYMDQSDPALYGRELAAYIHQDPSLADDLGKALASRLPIDPKLPMMARDDARRFLLRVDDVKKEIAFAEKLLLDDLDASNHFINSLDLHPAEKTLLTKPVKAEVTKRIGELQALSRDLRAEEFRFLDAYHRGEGAEDAIKAALDRINPKLSALDAEASRLATLNAVHVRGSAIIRSLDPADAREFLTGDPLAHPSLRNTCARLFGFLH
jgi:hypothetical protein